MSSATEQPRSLNEVREELRIHLPDTMDYVDLLFEVLEIFQESDFYVSSPESVSRDEEDIDEIAEEVMAQFKREFESLSQTDAATVRDNMQTLYELLIGPNLYKHFLQPTFDHLGITTQEIEEGEKGKKHVYNKFRVPNLHRNRKQLEEFFMALGLEGRKKAGKGSHMKWSDPKGEMTQGINSTNSDIIWIKTIIKELIAKGMPIERIEAACNACDIGFEKK